MVEGLAIRVLILLGLGVASTTPLYAAHVLEKISGSEDRVVISTGGLSRLKLKDAICLYRKNRKVACGAVVQLSGEKATVELTERLIAVGRKTFSGQNFGVRLKFVRRDIRIGDLAEYKNRKKIAVARKTARASEKPHVLKAPTSPPSPEPSPTPEPSPSPPPPLPPTPELPPPAAEAPPPSEPADPMIVSSPAPEATSDLSLGFNYVFPMVHYQFAVADHFALGISSLFVDYSLGGGEAFKGFGGLLTFNYYHDGRFRGMQVHLSTGIYPLTLEGITGSEKVSSFGVGANVGWRWHWDSGTNVGFAIGAQSLVNPRLKQVLPSYSGVLPSILMDIGFTL